MIILKMKYPGSNIRIYAWNRRNSGLSCWLRTEFESTTPSQLGGKFALLALNLKLWSKLVSGFFVFQSKIAYIRRRQSINYLRINSAGNCKLLGIWKSCNAIKTTHESEYTVCDESVKIENWELFGAPFTFRFFMCSTYALWTVYKVGFVSDTWLSLSLFHENPRERTQKTERAR